MTMGTVGDALKISATGFALVFLALVCLGVFITIVSKIVGAIEKNTPKGDAGPKQPAKPTAKPVVEDKVDTALLAAIIGAVSEETKLSVDKFTITSIEERKSDDALVAAIVGAVSAEADLSN
ncbi:sodium pump decarboxylase subunit gamma [Anaerosphaera multitolerans]|uniref:Sodium pump decarboxylase subunit gamma n=2 Tax=Anaerosphaera multitolerans TaxID=2487351 RepID=A0A437S742_9FIRM|nr:sodium pump decarboxylase subunit gamma [Anaerosphaera multitolerans]